MNTDQNSKGHDSQGANKGLNTSHFMMAVLAAIVVIIVGTLVFLGSGRTRVIPHANAPKPTTATPPAQ